MTNNHNDNSTSVLGKRRKVRQRHKEPGARMTKEERLARREAREAERRRGPSEDTVAQVRELLSCVRPNETIDAHVVAQLDELVLPHPELQLQFVEQLLLARKTAQAKHRLHKFVSMLRAQSDDVHALTASLALRLCTHGAEAEALVVWEVLYTVVDLPQRGVTAVPVPSCDVLLPVLSSSVLKEIKSSQSTTSSAAAAAAAAAAVKPSKKERLQAALDHLCVSAFKAGQGKVWVLARALVSGSQQTIKKICRVGRRTALALLDVLVCNQVMYRELISEAPWRSRAENFARALAVALSSGTAQLTAAVHPDTVAMDDRAAQDALNSVLRSIAASSGMDGDCNTNGSTKSSCGINSATLSESCGSTVARVNAVMSKAMAHSVNRYDVVLFGSHAVPGLATSASDVDICVVVEGDIDPVQVLERVHSSLSLLQHDSDTDGATNMDSSSRCGGETKLGRVSNLLLVGKARIPILKWKDEQTGLQVDMTVNNHAAVRNTELVRERCSQWPNMMQLVRLVRMWARRRAAVDHKHGLNAHAWTVMVAFYLEKKHPQRTPVSLWRLLVGFWAFFAIEVNFARDCVELGREVWHDARVVAAANSNDNNNNGDNDNHGDNDDDDDDGHKNSRDRNKEAKKNPYLKPHPSENATDRERTRRSKTRTTLWVVDPCEQPSRDLGQKLSRSESMRIKAEFIRATRLLARLPLESALSVAFQRVRPPRKDPRTSAFKPWSTRKPTPKTSAPAAASGSAQTSTCSPALAAAQTSTGTDQFVAAMEE